ncbi:hypothetical protein ACN47E_009323 [Coniothyrium glycines]
MKSQSIILAALASAPAALAHTVFTDFYVDGMPQGDGVAMRMSPFPETAGSPIASLDSEDMACNVGGTKGVSRVQSVKDGALLTFEIRSYANDPSKERLERGHKGPCAVYLKKVDSAINDKATGDGWFKLFDHGYDSSTDRWCTDEIIDNNGLLSVNLPKGLEGGSYLARPEILALHAANSGDPQMYTGCAQIFLESSGDLVPESTVSIPGYVKYGQPSTSFDIYNTDNAKYTVPGPSVAKLTSRGTQVGSTLSTSQTEGLKPAGCLVENGNWCGKEVPDYSTETGCWASSEDCWNQSQTCYDSSQPTGNAGCELWQTKCKAIQNECSAGNFNGPPNKGKVLTPSKNAIDVGKIMATVGGGIVDAPSNPKTSAAATTATPVKEIIKSAAPTPSAPAAQQPRPSSAAAPAAAKPTPANSYPSTPQRPNTNDKPIAHDKPVHTITVAPSSAGAPAPTGEPCPAGWACVTVTEWETVTTTVYVTPTAEPARKSAVPVYRRKHGRRV